MFPFLETIKIKNGKVQRAALHQERINATILATFATNKHSILLKNIFRKTRKNGQFPSDKNTVFKCRLLYDASDYFIEFVPYQMKEIKTLKLVTVSSDFDYALKYANRDNLNQLVVDNQEVIIVKNNKITDTTYANIAFLKGSQWFTPDEPLLKGTMRAYLIRKKKIIPRSILLTDLKEFSQLKVFNAMIEWNESAGIDVPVV
jgi:4-amino-4-deoxychorismate lyase